MFCKFCGKGIDENAFVCPHCSKELSDSDLTSSSLQKVNRYPNWFKILIFVGIIGIFVGVYQKAFSTDPLDTIEEQLQALRENKISEAYYSYTSKGFQEDTPLDSFREFINGHNIFSQYHSFILTKSNLEKNNGTIEGFLVANDGKKHQILYQLVRDENEWKIIQLQLNEPQEATEEFVEVTEQEALKLPVSIQLNALKRQDMSRAYDEVVSIDFKKETPLDQFEAFVQEYPVLGEFSEVEYENFRVKDQRGSLFAMLSGDKGSLQVEYKLIKEGGKWKIWSLRVVLPVDKHMVLNTSETKPLIDLVKEQIQAISEGNMRKAYEEYTSQDFKKATSWDDFREFIQKFPFLYRHDTEEVQQSWLKNGVGKVTLELGNKSSKTWVEFMLGKENDQWKIWGIEILKNPEQSSESHSINGIEKELKQVVENQIKKIREKQYQSAYQEYTSTDFQKLLHCKNLKILLRGSRGSMTIRN